MQEPPTPMRNADFRSLVASARRPPAIPGSATEAHSSSALASPTSSSSSSSSLHAAPAKSTKRLEHYQRYLAKQAARQQSGDAENSDGSASKPGRLLYRDRAAERRADDVRDYEPLPSSIVDVSEEASKFLGGDEEHTHLVKGLDYALLRKIREEEQQREQGKLDQLLHEHTAPTALPSPPSPSRPPVFHSLMAQAVYELACPPAVTPSDLFLPGRLSYSIAVPVQSRFALLPIALASPAPQSTALLASLNERPLSVLVAKDDLPPPPETVSGFVHASVLQRVRAALEKRRDKKGKSKPHGHATNAQSNEQRRSAAASDEEAEEKQPEPRALTVEERRKLLMEADDDDIFADVPPAAGASQPAAPSPSAPVLPPSAVFKPAAPSSKYFETRTSLSIAAPLPMLEEKEPVAPVPAGASEPRVPAPRAPPSMEDEYEELYPETALAFSGHFAGDEDSDDEAEAFKDKERLKQEKLIAKRGRRKPAANAGVKREEQRREAKMDSQLAGVTELLKKDAGKLRLETFERDGVAQDAAKRLRIG